LYDPLWPGMFQYQILWNYAQRSIPLAFHSLGLVPSSEARAQGVPHIFVLRFLATLHSSRRMQKTKQNQEIGKVVVLRAPIKVGKKNSQI